MGFWFRIAQLKSQLLTKNHQVIFYFIKVFYIIKEPNITEHSKAFENYACSYMVKLLFSRFNKST